MALPKELEQMNPEFFHITAEQIPAWEQDGVNYKLIAGEAFKRTSVVPVYSRMYMIEIKSNERKLINIGDQLYGESGLYILEGGIESDGQEYASKQMLVTKESHLCSFTILPYSTIYIFGGHLLLS